MNPVVIGSFAVVGGSTTFDISVTEPAAVGDLVLVVVGDGVGFVPSGPLLISVTDSRGNSYTALANQAEVNGDSDIAVYAAQVTTALQVGDSITVVGVQSWTRVQAVALDCGAVEVARTGDLVGVFQDVMTSTIDSPVGNSVIGVVITYDTTVTNTSSGTWVTDYDNAGDQTTIFIVHQDDAPEFSSLVTGPYDLYGASFTVSVGTSVTPAATEVDASGVASSAALGRPTVTGGTPLIKPAGIASSAAVGAPKMRMSVKPVGIPPSVSLGTPLVVPDVVYPAIIGPSTQFGVPTITQGLPPNPTPPPPLVHVPLVQNNSRYKFIITDMLGNVKGEVLEASNKEFIQVLDNMQTAKFTVKLTNPMADYILNHDCLCKCYRQPVSRGRQYQLLLVGDVITEEESATNETGTITFTVVDPLHRLMYRLLGKEIDPLNNRGKGFSVGTPNNPANVVDVVAAMLAEVNTDPQLGHSGVGMGTRVDGTPDAFLAPVYFQSFATQLAVYTAALDGLDFWMEPVEPYSLSHYPPRIGTRPYITGGPPRYTPVEQIVKGTSVHDTIIARLNMYWPVGNYLQSAGPPPVYSKRHPYPVFEYGTGKRNVQAYRRVRDKSQLTNLWHNLPNGFPLANSSEAPVVVTDRTTVTPEGTVQNSINRRGGYESVDPADLGSEQAQGAIVGMSPRTAVETVRSMRQALVNADAAVTAMARQQIQFTPTINCDVDWTVDYFVGDIVTVRAYVPEIGSWRFNGTVRIYGVDASIDDNEQEQIQITTVPVGAAAL